jgi:uncharacterized protein (TIGR03067 family)
MAIKSSFKQQCPSCEAMVPIRDPKLIGRKIDCPKCKYRFVVEEPVDEVEEDEEGGKKSKSDAITDKKPANGKAAKAPAKRRADDDQDQEPQQKKKQGGSGMLVVGIVLAGIAVIALAVGAVFLFSDRDESKPSGGRSGGSASQASENTQADNKGKNESAGPKPRQDDITNLLPNDTQIVVNMPLEHLLGNPRINQSLLKTPGAFHEAAFQQIWGVSPGSVQRVVIAYSADKKSVFSVMRTRPGVQMKEEQIVASLKLKPETPINGLKHYLIKKPLDTLSTLLLKGAVNHDKVALHFMDPFTVVCADVGWMNQFLQQKGQPTHLSKPGEEEQGGEGDKQGGEASPQGGGAKLGMGPPGMQGGGPPSGMQGGGPPSGMQGGPRQGGGPPGAPNGRQGGGPPSGPRGGPGGGFQPPSGMPPGMTPPNMTGGAGSASGPAPVSSSYLTVDKHLKSVLDQAERVDKSENQNVLLSVAVLTAGVSEEEFKKGMAQQGSNMPQIPDVALRFMLDAVKSQLKAVGLAVTEFNESKFVANAAAGVKDATLAQDWEKRMNDAIPGLLAMGGLDLVSKNAARNNNNNTAGGPGSGMMPPGMQGGMMGMQGGGMMQQQQMQQQMRQRMQMQGMGMQGGGVMPPGMQGGGAMPPGMQGGPAGGLPGMQPQGQGEGETQQEKGKQGEYEIWTKDNVLAGGLNLNITRAQYDGAGILLEVEGIIIRSLTAMAESSSRIHELAAATQAYLEEKGHFPRGTVARPPDSQRAIDWRPDQRLSWMTQLLPYLANGEFKDIKPDHTKAWYEEMTNQKAGLTVVPQFVTQIKSDDPTYFYVPYPNLPTKGPGKWAVTHFVGMAGIGLDAAEYRADDPATAKLRGVFGYDRETTKKEITDGLDQTIVLIQVPPQPKSPWIAGGGSTVRGVSEDRDCVKPFVSTEYHGQPGTFAIMADGKVRFIPATIKPETFRALCTIAGEDRVKDLDKIAPEVPPPEETADQPALKAEQPAPAVPPPALHGNNDQSQDLQKLQGTWVQVGGENQGRAMPPDMVQQMAVKLVITGDKFVMTWNDKGNGDAMQGGTLKLEETKAPKTFDGQITMGRQTGSTLLGNYSLSGDELKICYSKPGGPRPVSFTTKDGESGTALFIFKREKP